MNEVLKYKGFIGSVEVSVEDKCLFGRVLNSSALIIYEGNTVQELEEGFRYMVDDYLTELEELGETDPAVVAIAV